MDSCSLPDRYWKFSIGRIFLFHLHLKMAVYYSPEKVAEIVKKHTGDDKNTGNVEAQVALLTYRIESLSKHLQTNKKDHSTRRSLLHMVGQRKRLLNYYMKKDIYKYRALIEKLGLRK